jgi:hypothetical protein
MWPAIAIVVGMAVISIAGYFEHRTGHEPNRFGFSADAGVDASP